MLPHFLLTVTGGQGRGLGVASPPLGKVGSGLWALASVLLTENLLHDLGLAPEFL